MKAITIVLMYEPSLLYEIFKMVRLGWAFQSLGEEGVILEQTNFPGHLRQYFEMDL